MENICCEVILVLANLYDNAHMLVKYTQPCVSPDEAALLYHMSCVSGTVCRNFSIDHMLLKHTLHIPIFHFTGIYAAIMKFQKPTHHFWCVEKIKNISYGLLQNF